MQLIFGKLADEILGRIPLKIDSISKSIYEKTEMYLKRYYNNLTDIYLVEVIRKAHSEHKNDKIISTNPMTDISDAIENDFLEHT